MLDDDGPVAKMIMTVEVVQTPVVMTMRADHDHRIGLRRRSIRQRDDERGNSGK